MVTTDFFCPQRRSIQILRDKRMCAERRGSQYFFLHGTLVLYNRPEEDRRLGTVHISIARGEVFRLSRASSPR